MTNENLSFKTYNSLEDSLKIESFVEQTTNIMTV